MLEGASLDRRERQDRQRAVDAVRRELIAAAALLLATTAGCDAGEPAFAIETPPPNVRAVNVTTFDAAAIATVRTPLASDGSTRPVTTTSLAITFDRYLDPRTAVRQSFCFQSDLAEVASAEQCLKGIATTPTYDPVSRTVTLYFDAPLVADTQYKLTLYAASDDLDFGFRAFDSVPLAQPVSFAFRTNETDPAPAPPGFPGLVLEAPSDIDEGLLCEEVAALLSDCQTCHQETDVTKPPPPENLTFTRTGLAQAIDRVARQTALGDQGDDAASKPGRFGAGMPLFQTSNPGNSYVLYKALARAIYNEDTLADGELERLRSWIVGMPMPASEAAANGDPPRLRSPELDGENLQRLSNWIAVGARCE